MRFVPLSQIPPVHHAMAMDRAPGSCTKGEDLGTARGIFGNVDADLTPELVIYINAAGPVQQGWIIL